MSSAPRVAIVTINDDEYLYSRVCTRSVLTSDKRLTRLGTNRDFIDRPPLISVAELHQYEHRVLDTFPLTLADLLPEGCTEFRFNSAGFRSLAVKKLNGAWEVTGMHGDWTDLNELAFDCDVDLNTVVPLTVHPDWIEKQR